MSVGYSPDKILQGRLPSQADAHYNAARLNEQLGRRQAALRHYNAYRRLVPR